jgi:hypothetical protein
VGTRVFALGVGVVLMLAGCSGKRPADASVGAAPTPGQVIEVPAAAAGGACILWDYAFIEEQLGVLFDVAAADQVANASTCVVQSAGAARPDLSLSVVEHTEADAALFAADLAPSGAVKIKNLGLAAYRLIAKAAGDHGPVIEVGWLSADQQLMILRFTFPVGASPADAEAMAGRMMTLARKLNGDVE